MAKNNIRSVRYTDEVKSIVVKMPGEGFNEKFENMVLTYATAEKELKEKLKDIEKNIERKRKELSSLSDDCSKLFRLKYDFDTLNSALERIKCAVSSIDVTQYEAAAPAPGVENE